MGTTEEIRIGQLVIRFLLEGQDSGGAVAIFEVDVPAGANVPIAHSHDAYEETIYGLEGVLTWTLDGHRSELGPGQVLCIRRGVVHRFDNLHDVDAKMLAIVSPASLARATSAKSPPWLHRIWRTAQPCCACRSHAPPWTYAGSVSTPGASAPLGCILGSRDEHQKWAKAHFFIARGPEVKHGGQDGHRRKSAGNY